MVHIHGADDAACKHLLACLPAGLHLPGHVVEDSELATVMSLWTKYDRQIMARTNVQEGEIIDAASATNALIANLRDQPRAPTLDALNARLEISLLNFETLRLKKIESLEDTTIVSGGLEVFVSKAPRDRLYVIEGAKQAERVRTAAQITQLKEDVAKRNDELTLTSAAREVVLDECDRLRGDIAALHSRRDVFASSVNSTLGSRIDLQMSCRKNAAAIRDTFKNDTGRREDLGRIQSTAERQRHNAAKHSDEMHSAVDSQKTKKIEVYQASSKIRGEVIQERQFLIRQTRDLNKVKADLEELKPRNAETEEMLSKFEPGFSDRSLARVAELNAEVVQAKSHLKQARIDRDELILKCDAETAAILAGSKQSAEAKQAAIAKKERGLMRLKLELGNGEATSLRAYEGVKASTKAAREEIKTFNLKLIAAEAKCSAVEEDLDDGILSHSANINTIKENITSLRKIVEALNKVAIKKEQIIKRIKLDVIKNLKRMKAEEHVAKAQVTATAAQGTIFAESKRRAERDEQSQHSQHTASIELEGKLKIRHADLLQEEFDFEVQNKLNVASAQVRIFPARAAGYDARTELEQILGKLGRIQDQQSTLDTIVNHHVTLFSKLHDEQDAMEKDKSRVLQRQSQAREHLDHAVMVCRTALDHILQERHSVQRNWDVADTRYRTAWALHDRLIRKHTKCHMHVHAYRQILGPMTEAVDAVKQSRVDHNTKLTAVYTEIRTKHEQFTARIQRTLLKNSDSYADFTMRSRAYIGIARRLRREEACLGDTLQRAVEVRTGLDADQFDKDLLCHNPNSTAYDSPHTFAVQKKA